ncbi:MAG: DUF1513 domain-containing protein [Alphaproteobacteria bacterium]|jgi:hypothetical protein|nr:DUF1513 domain-containing protein [Alphaproteobacteria bacterium]
MDRRAVLAGLAAGLPMLPALAGATATGVSSSDIRLFAGSQDADGNNSLSLADDRGTARRLAGLPDRGHAVSLSPDGRLAVLCARRAGRFAVVFDPRTGAIRQRLATPETRHFYGHGAFSRDGRLFLATENAFEEGEGRIGVYDAVDGFRRIGEWPAGGIGPHEVVRVPGRDAVLVAIGGLRTHPATGRAKLNVDSMTPSLALMDGRDGAPLGILSLDADLRRLSLRHLAVRRDGVFMIGGQWEGDPTARPPLLAWGRLPDRLAPLPLVDDVLDSLANYIGSLSFCGSGDFAAASAPRGNCCVVLRMGDPPRIHDVLAIEDVCGLAPGQTAGAFYLSNGLGDLFRYRATERAIERLATDVPGIARWDNHLTAVTVEPRR